MVEVQCWEGDGIVPPEVKALVMENERLKGIVKDLETEVTHLRKRVSVVQEISNNYGQKLYEIERILAYKEEPEPVYDPRDMPKEDFLTEMAWRSEPKVALPHERIDLKTVKTAADRAFDILQGNA